MGMYCISVWMCSCSNDIVGDVGREIYDSECFYLYLDVFLCVIALNKPNFNKAIFSVLFLMVVLIHTLSVCKQRRQTSFLQMLVSKIRFVSASYFVFVGLMIEAMNCRFIL